MTKGDIFMCKRRYHFQISARRFIISTLAVSLLTQPFSTISVHATQTLPINRISSILYAKDYNAIPNTKYDWWLIRNTTHDKVEGGVPDGINLNKYNAYYMDEKTDEKVIYLTFDCGYENGYTKKILKALKKHNAKALFFVTKSYIASNPDLVKQMKEEGHMVGNHTSTHPSLPSKSVDEFKKELLDCAELYQEVTGYPIDTYIRPPMGHYSQRTLQISKDLGYKTIFWSIAYYDYDVNDQPGKDYVVNYFKDNHHKGAIPLIHNTSQSNCEALDDVLSFLKESGYRFGTMDEFTLKKGSLKITCTDKPFDKKAATATVISNTNRDVDITYTYKDTDGNIVKEAIKTGDYTVTATAPSNNTYSSVISNTVSFSIYPPEDMNIWNVLEYLYDLYNI